MQMWALLSGFMRACGKPHLEIKLLLFDMCISIPLSLIFVQYGLTIFLMSKIFAFCFEIILYGAFEHHYLNIRIVETYQQVRGPLYATLVMVLGTFPIRMVLQNQLGDTPVFLTLVVLSGIVYLGSLRLFSPGLVNDLSETAIHILRGSRSEAVNLQA